ncbi:MAG: DUF2326 domain-containing protein [Phycisphaerae bacterium]|nr:DUF2326 domain-containing protein [Phycisphaerae bacterium]
MIHSVRSTLETFRTVECQPGMNVVLADTTKKASEKDSRNGLGKTTLLSVIDFCLGAQETRGEGLLAEPLRGIAFMVEMTVGGKRLLVTRHTSDPSTVVVEWSEKGEVDLFGNAPKASTEYSIREWTRILGFQMFGLPRDAEERSGVPSFRALISYFLRTGKGAFLEPFVTTPKLLLAERQIYNTFLLGLEWSHAVEWKLLRDRLKELKSLKISAKRGMVKEMLGSLGQLKAHRVQLVEQQRRQRADLKAFKVHPQYEQIENEADSLTQKIHELSNEEVSERQLLTLYRQSLADERVPAAERIAGLFEQAGVAFPDMVRRRLDEVEVFHKTVVENRRKFLTIEVERLEAASAGRKAQVRELSDRRAVFMSILETHRALDEYTKLQSLLGETEARLADIERRIAMLTEFEQGSTEASIALKRLEQRAKADLAERDGVYQAAVKQFSANSQALYDAPGDLIIDIGPNGHRFGVEIQRSSSDGVGNMKIFCYDLLLAQLWSKRPHSPGFLAHDSTIFDGVDERQVAHALELAAKESKDCGFQYICTMNSDAVPTSRFSNGFSIDPFVRLRLTDTDPAGCLMGVRY